MLAAYDMGDFPQIDVTRRTVLRTATGALLSGGLAATSTGTTGTTPYHVTQGETCLPFTPLSGSIPAEELYHYQLPAGRWAGQNDVTDDDGRYYSSTGTQSLQRHDTSLLFLYDGPKGLSLVVVHGKTGPSPNGGGSVTFTISGLPRTGHWVVKDDLYLDPETGEQAASNYDRWQRDGSTHTITWTWGSTGTDGGVFRDLGGDVSVTIEPAFNEAAMRLDKNYEGSVTAWHVLSGSLENPERYAVAMDQPITIANGGCPSDGRTGSDGRDDLGLDSDTETTDTDDDSETKSQADTDSPPYYVCHKPPGNPSNAHTIKVGSKQALEAHLAHGDSKGRCRDGNQDGQ